MRVRCRMSIFLLLTSSCKVYSGSPYPPRYSDLQEVFGTDYCAATGHYITNGVDENRLGYNPSGGYGRYTVQNSASGIYLSTSDRTAGAVDSLAWNNKEFINSYDHGRQFQVSWFTICFSRSVRYVRYKNAFSKNIHNLSFIGKDYLRWLTLARMCILH